MSRIYNDPYEEGGNAAARLTRRITNLVSQAMDIVEDEDGLEVDDNFQAEWFGMVFEAIDPDEIFGGPEPMEFDEQLSVVVQIARDSFEELTALLMEDPEHPMPSLEDGKDPE